MEEEGWGGGERCPLLPPPPPLFEFKCFCVRVSFISPDEHISSKWMLMFQPIDGYCLFIYLFIFINQLRCACVRMRIATIFLFHGMALHPSIKASVLLAPTRIWLLIVYIKFK